MLKKHGPGGCCCCPDCTAPDLESTGSTSANSAWYLIPDDPASVTYQDRASWLAIACGTAVDQTVIDPTEAWGKFRLYFAYGDSSNHAFAEIWGVLAISPTRVTWTVRVCVVSDATETELANHSTVLYGTGYDPPTLAVTYDEATGNARVVGMAQYGTVAWRTYDLISLASGGYYYDSDYGIRYGWGYGDIENDADELAVPTPKANTRHIDYCQGFPWLWDGGDSVGNHSWLKSSIDAVETITVDASGIGSCSACNDPKTLEHPSETQIAGSQTTHDMVTDEIETGWTGTLPSTLGGFAIDWLLSFRLDVIPTTGALVRLSIIGRYRFVVGATTYYGDPLALASQSIGFGGACTGPPEYDARDAIDGLIYDTWTLYDWTSWIAFGGTPGVPDLSNAEAVLSIPT